MRCLSFYGSTVVQTVDEFNKWAKDKPLSRDVIIREQIVQPTDEWCGEMIILVFFDEKLHPAWVGASP